MNDDRLALWLLEALPHSVSVVDAAGRLVYANPVFWQRAGIQPAACPPGTPLREAVRMLAYRGLCGPGDPEAQAEAVLAIDRSQPSRRQYTLADGSRSFENASVPLPDGGFAVVSHEITALLRGRDEMAARARLLESTLAGLAGGVARFDAETRLAFFNPAYEALLGLPGGTLRPGMTHEEVLAALDARGEFAVTGGPAASRRAISQARSGPSTSQRVRPSGEVLRFDAAPSAEGGLVVEATDITALKRAEDEARRRAALLDGVLAALPHGVCVYGPDRRVQMFNAAYARLMSGTQVEVGERVEEVVARRLAAGEYDARTAEAVLARYEPGAAPMPVMRRIRPNGTVLENNMARLPDGGVISVFTDVTALHWAEEAARSRAALLDAVLRALPHGICVYGPDLRVALFNEAYARIMEGSPIALGEHIDEIAERRVAAGEFTADYLAGSRARIAAGDPGREEVRVRPNGTVIAVRAAPLPQGGHISVVTDVTAVHRAEAAARERAALLDGVLESLPDGVVVYGADGRARMTNPAYRRIMGETAVRPGESLEELAARRVAQGELTREMAQALVRRHFGPGEEGGQPHRRLRPDGTAIVTRAGRLSGGGHIAVISDITALHRAEQELRQREAMQSAMLSTIRQGVILYGPDRRVLASNARTAELIGLPPASLAPGRLMDEIIDEQVARGQLDEEHAARMKRLDREDSLHYSRARPDGRVLDIVSEPTPDGGYVITYTDVTEEREIRAELEAARAAAEAASQAKSRFLATMSHELRTPLNAVIGLSEAIAAEREKPRADEFAALINEAGRHLLGLVDDILDVARSQTGALSVEEVPFRPAEVVEAAVAAARPAAEAAGIDLGAGIAAGLPMLRADPRRLRQVLDKLLSNAVKFTPAGGRVRVLAEEGAAGLVIRVVDTGIGIPPAERERMFEPFTQLDASLARRFQGSGLGLHLARTLAAALGGTLTLEDPQGPGLVAVLRFPPERVHRDPATATA